ncbi:hypothetical protein CO662_14420 [Rhizobium anhuiense]|uniref:Annexin n=1 Tax=Rhizobium anhuiense TaxID=1184720 RepID=A0ABX4JBN4_9HYPH|nr:hypothetical protein [Rhizobium anhuiense]PDS45390.1 hypothetical protein CO668_08730 [Rhizobium anhuiense]PDS51647.1 hypothetical protein CO662_14420 [Rhizobium anhuiense]
MIWVAVILVVGFLLYTYLRGRVRHSHAALRRKILAAQSEAAKAIGHERQQPTWFNKDTVASQELGRECALAAKRAGLSDDEVKTFLTDDRGFAAVVTIAAQYEKQGMSKSAQIVATSDDIERIIRIDPRKFMVLLQE